MKKFNRSHSTTSMYKHRTLIASLAVLLIGGVGFAATGGTETVKRIFVKLKLVGSNGETLEGVILEMPADGEDGTMTIDLDMGDGQQGTVTVQRLDASTLGVEGDDSGAGIILTKVSIDAGVADSDAVDATILSRDGEPASMIIDRIDDEATFKTMTITLGENAEDVATLADRATGETQQVMLRNVTSADGDGTMGATFSKLQIIPRETFLQQMDDSEAVANWVDDDGVFQELFVLPRVSDEPAAAGFHLLVAYDDENGERSFRMVGNMTGLDPETSSFNEIEWGEDNQPTLLFITDEGQEISLKVNLDNTLTDAKKMIRVELSDDGGIRQTRQRKQAPDDR